MAKRKLEEDRIDRISELPSDIRQHILSFLSTRDAIRSSILSTTWRHEWLSLPCLDFGKAFFRQHWKCPNIWNTLIERRDDDDDTAKVSEFLAFVKRALLRHTATIQELQLFLPASNELNSKVASCINGLSSISITKLSLDGLNLIGTSVDVIQLPSLWYLSLSKVIMDQKLVENLIANIPAVEIMHFCLCKGFKSLKVVGLPKLKQLVESDNFDLQRVEIDAPNLYFLKHQPYSDYQPYSNTATTELILSPSCQSITHLWLECWDGAFDWVNLHRKQLLHLKDLSILGSSTTNVLRHINLWATSLETLCIYASENLAQFDITCCQNLAKILLSGRLSDDWLNRHLRLLAHLRVLELYCNDAPTRLTISSNTLKCLTISMDCQNLEHVEVDCPNLLEFTYFIKENIPSISSGVALAPCVCILLSRGTSIESFSYVQLIGLFKMLRTSNYLSLYVDTLKKVIISEELRQNNESPLCHCENLRVMLRETLTTEDITACIDSLLWLCPELKTIHITDLVLFPYLKTQSEIYIKLQYKEPMELGPEGCGCYERLRINCWKHSLKDFEIIKHCGVKDDGSLRRFFESAILGTKTIG